MDYIVITSINEPTAAVIEFAKNVEFEVVVVADLKTPLNWHLDNPRVTFLSVDDQKLTKSSLEHLLPFNHYSRKMLGYLLAIKRGATSIIDTDDDNFPESNFFFPPMEGNFNLTQKNLGWVNVYKFFSEENIWPRGLPLEEIKSKFDVNLQSEGTKIGIWQSLADGDTDVDAIYRLVFDKHVKFSPNISVVLKEGTYSPFNSQSTKFSEIAYPLLYLPSTVTFRFTDILRGIVAQPILHCLNLKIGFTSPIFHQERNAHNYLSDFESEVPMYLNSKRALSVVSNVVSAQNSISSNLVTAYKALTNEGIVDSSELELLNAWLEDLQRTEVTS